MKKIISIFMLSSSILFCENEFFPIRRVFRFYCNTTIPTKITKQKKMTLVKYYDITFYLKATNINEENIKLKCESLVNKIIKVQRDKSVGP